MDLGNMTTFEGCLSKCTDQLFTPAFKCKAVNFDNSTKRCYSLETQAAQKDIKQEANWIYAFRRQFNLCLCVFVCASGFEHFYCDTTQIFIACRSARNHLIDVLAAEEIIRNYIQSGYYYQCTFDMANEE
ncbi:unnamed protein product [Protopolystoma xenopodis]|uniref:Apple domain-containing protein n=1 Tax=Protopolystoma xenopodis TaxID=117903 RepID=A0A448WDT9_9PLAT|nr:unnamed protein product [Protopolystoma xenopodis]